MSSKGGLLTSFFATHRSWIAITTLIGTIVGAGVLGIPYAVAKLGFLYGSLLILLLGIAYIFLNLFMGEVVLRTKGQHQLTGYAELYLGKMGKRLMAFSMLFGIYGALTAYLIGEGSTLYTLLGIGSPLLYSLLFFLVSVAVILLGIKATGKAELFLIGLLLVVVLGIGIFSYDKINIEHLRPSNLLYFFIPYGVIMFAFAGSPAVPEMQEVLMNEKRKLKKAILLGSLIPIMLYLLFTFIVMGLVSLPQFEALEPNQRLATIALSMYSSPLLGTFANVMAILTMLTSFLSLGLALLEMYDYDYALSRTWSAVLTFTIPVLIVIFGLTSFITILELTGSFAGGLNGILVILMFWKAKQHGTREPEYSLGRHAVLGMFLILLFVVGMLYQLWAHILSL